MENSLYEASSVKDYSNADEKGITIKLRLLDGHFYDNVFFSGSFKDLITIVEKAQMLYIKKSNGDQIFINTRLIVDFVIA